MTPIVKNPPAMYTAGDTGFDPWTGKIPWRMEWLLILVGESHGQRSLGAYRPWGRKESNMTERLTLSKVICRC